MKNMKTAVIAGIIGACAGIVSAEVTVSGDFLTAYVFRGTTFNNGAVFQPTIEANGLGVPEEYGSVTVGAWGNYDISDYGTMRESSEFSEIDWYGSYSLPAFVEGLDLFIGYTEYTYPNAADDADKEMNMGIGYSIAGVDLGTTWYRGVGGEASGDNWLEMAVAYGYDITDELSAGVAADVRFLDSRDGDTGWNDYTIGTDIGYALNEIWSVGASLTYIGQCDNGVLPDETTNRVNGDFGYSVDWVGAFGVSATF